MTDQFGTRKKLEVKPLDLKVRLRRFGILYFNIDVLTWPQFETSII